MHNLKSNKSVINFRFIIVLILLVNLSFSNAFGQDGVNDTTFNPGFGANATIDKVTLQNDGKIIISGGFTAFNNVPRKYLARLNSNGFLDTSFDTGSGFNGLISSTAIQDDGKVLIGGEFHSVNGIAANYLARLKNDGSVDGTFNMGSGPDDILLAIAVQSDGKILIGGRFTHYNGFPIKYIARLNPDGSLDGTFNLLTNASQGNVANIFVQPDGKILLGARLNTMASPSNNILRINSNGSIDNTFNPGGYGVDQLGIYDIALQNDGKTIIGGYFLNYNGVPIMSLARLNADGTLDQTFNIGSGPNSNLYVTNIQNDGKILIGCAFTGYNGTPIKSLARINSDGSLDPTFNPGTSTENGAIFASALQPDGKLIIAGSFSKYNGANRNNIARVFITPQVDPFKLVSFRGEYSPCGNTLYWHTTGETYTKRYVIERSTDGIHFSAIDSVIRTGAIDNSYEYSDTTVLPLAGHIFYRLKFVKINGSITYSNVLDLSIVDSPVKVSPNPVKDFVTVTVSDCMLNRYGTVINVSGQRMQIFKIVNRSLRLNLSDYPRGVYFLKVGGIQLQKIIKE